MNPVIDRISISRISADVSLKYGRFERSSLRTIVVEVESQGITGWGECGGRKWKRFLDPYDSCVKLAKQLVGRELSNPSEVLRKDPRNSLESDRWSNGYNGAFRSAREALSIALYDLHGKIRGIPVYDLLGGQSRKTFHGMPVIHVSSPASMAAVAGAWHKKGYRYLKIKLGPDDCIARLEAIRNEVGSDVDLQLDFNHSLKSFGDTISLIKELDTNFDINIVEDPVRASNSTFREIRNGIGPSLMMDSGTFWPRIRRVAAAQCIDLINHHTDQQGGLDLAILISKTAQAQKIESAVGSSGLVGISESAFQQLAAVIGLTRPCESILFSEYAAQEFNNYYGTEGLSVIEQGHHNALGVIELNDKPGLGVEIRADLVADLAIQHSRILAGKRGAVVAENSKV